MKLTVMTLQRKTYARHQYVTPQGHGAHGNRIVSEVVVRWVSGGRGRLCYYYYYFTSWHNPLKADGGVGNKGMSGSKGGGAGQCLS